MSAVTGTYTSQYCVIQCSVMSVSGSTFSVAARGSQLNLCAMVDRHRFTKSRSVSKVDWQLFYYLKSVNKRNTCISYVLIFIIRNVLSSLLKSELEARDLANCTIQQ